MPTPGAESERRERRRHRWRFSRSQNKMDQPTSPPPHAGPLGMMSPKEQAMSRSTIGSSNASASQPRRSFQEPVPLRGSMTDTNNTPTQTPGPHGGANDSGVFSDSERERRGPMGWIRGKLQERKDRDAERRTRTPERNQSSANGRQEFGTPVHMESLAERQRNVSSATGADAGAPPLPVSGATVVTPAVNTTVNPPTQAQETAEPAPSSSARAPVELVDERQPSVPADPVIHDRVDAVMGGK
jgi:hypothetical protein